MRFSVPALLLFILAIPLPALSFAPCTDAGYLAIFDPDPTLTDCELRHDTSLTLNGITRPMRFISAAGVWHGDDTAWKASVEDLLDRIEIGADAMGPGLRTEPITVFLTDYARTLDDGGAVDGARLGASWPGECDIDMYKVGAADAETWNFALAHEIFHCIQHHTWPDQIQASGAKWWVEGSANFFGSMVVPESGYPLRQIAEFGNLIETTSLFDAPLDYENVVLFDHVHQNHGPASVADFIAALPADGGYLNHLQRHYDLNAWAGFAESYLLGHVTEPGGQPIEAPSGAQLLLLVDGESSEFEFSTDAYRLFRASVEIPAGAKFRISVEGGTDLRSRISLDNSGWTDLPQEVEACDTDRSVLVYAVTTAGPETFRLRATYEGTCAQCRSASARDACMVGTWTMTGGGPIEWLRARGMGHAVQVTASEMSVTMFANGDYVMNPVTADVQADNSGNPVTGTGQSVGLSGTWGATEGELFICPLSGEIEVDVRTADGGVSMLFGPGGDVQMGYACAGDTLTTSAIIRAGLPPMDTVYSRTGP